MTVSRLRTLLRTFFIVFLSTVFLFVLLEFVFHVVGKPGTSKFIAQVADKNHLSPSKEGIDYRVFLVGESTLQGWPYSPRSTVGTWLNQYLSSFLPHKKIEIVNFGRLGEGSVFCLSSLKQLLPYHPDLVVIYVGHNDFFPGNRRDQAGKEIHSLKAFFRYLARKSRFLSAVERFAYEIRRKVKRRIQKGSQEDAVEVTPRGYCPDELSPVGSPEYEDCLAYYHENIEAIIRLARDKGISIVFFRPVSNFKDFSPNYSCFSRDLPDKLKEAYKSKLNKAGGLLREGNLAEAVRILEDLLRVDPRYAETLYLRAQAAEALGSYGEAKLFYLEALDYDGVHNRAPRPINQTLEELCTKYNVPLINTVGLFESASPDNLIGFNLIDDNCHPTIRGQAMMARELVSTIADKGWIAPFSEWQWKNEKTFDYYSEQLGIDNETFFEANLRLAGYFGSRHEEALKHISRALQIHPDSFLAKRYLAWRYWIMGKKKESLSIYRKLLREFPAETKRILVEHPEVRKELAF